MSRLLRLIRIGTLIIRT
ncbi:hypothetical protein EUTSA_v10004492mg, partial [Eutrema salsugineum]